MPFEEGFYALLEASGGPSGGFWRPETLLERLLCHSRAFWRPREASGGPSGGSRKPQVLLEGLLCLSRGPWRPREVLLVAPGGVGLTGVRLETRSSPSRTFLEGLRYPS